MNAFWTTMLTRTANSTIVRSHHSRVILRYQQVAKFGRYILINCWVYLKNKITRHSPQHSWSQILCYSSNSSWWNENVFEKAMRGVQRKFNTARLSLSQLAPADWQGVSGRWLTAFTVKLQPLCVLTYSFTLQSNQRCHQMMIKIYKEKQ